MSLGLSLSMRSNEEEHSLVGDIIRRTYEFVHEGDYNPSYGIASPVASGEKVLAKDYFHFFGNNRRNLIVKPEHLPHDPHVRAILFKRGRAYLETTRINFEELEERLQESSSEAHVKKASIFSDEERVIKTFTKNVGTYENQDRRTLLTILALPNTPAYDAALEAIDVLDNYACYHLEYAHALVQELSTGLSGAPQQVKMDVRLQQELSQLQTPKLAVELGLNYVLAVRAQQAQILKMNNTQLAEHLRKKVQENPVLEVE